MIVLPIIAHFERYVFVAEIIQFAEYFIHANSQTLNSLSNNSYFDFEFIKLMFCGKDFR